MSSGEDNLLYDTAQEGRETSVKLVVVGRTCGLLNFEKERRERRCINGFGEATFIFEGKKEDGMFCRRRKRGKHIARTLSDAIKGRESVRGMLIRKFVYVFLVRESIEDVRHREGLVLFPTLGFRPDFVHLGEGHVGELSPLFEGFGFEIVEAANELLVGALERVVGIDFVEACGIDE